MAGVGEVAAAVSYSHIQNSDVVRFKPGDGDEERRHGDLGLLMPSRSYSSISLLCMDGHVVAGKHAGELTVVDRPSLRPLMVVTSASDPTGQQGVVRDVSTVVDLIEHQPDGMYGAAAAAPVVQGVSPGALRRVREVTPGDYVVLSGHGRWLGRVVEVHVSTNVVFDDGAVCRLDVTTRCRLHDAVVRNYRHRTEANYCYYPGQRVTGREAAFENALWVRGYWKPSLTEGTVAKVTTTGAVVYWIASAQLGIDKELVDVAAPPAFQNPKDLTLFSSDEECYWGLADRCFIAADEAKPRGKFSFKKDKRSTRMGAATRAVDKAMVVAGTCTTAEVEWQDGTRSSDVPSAELVPIYMLNEYGSRRQQSRHHLRRPFMGRACPRVSRRQQRRHVSQVGDGETSMVAHHEIRFVDCRNIWDLQDDLGPWVAEQEEPAAAAADSNARNNVAGDAGNAGGGGANAPAPPPTPTLTGRIGAAVQSGIGVASRLLAHGKSCLASVSSSLPSSANSAAATASAEATAPSEPAADGDGGDANTDDGNGGDDESLSFARFDVVQCPLDHHYLDAKQEGAAHGNKWVKRVQKEWKILADDNLPGTIYVRAFEDRMDLLRAAMVGAAGTPYQDGLFLFDVHLPPTFPAVPPQVYYHSFGFRVNPNLYESSTVCLSLLNTFAGRDTEVWSLESSTLLQVLVSIQGLVLTGDPYYNEAGYEALIGTPEGRGGAFPYAENARLLTLRSALQLLRRPPRGFEDLVRAHFRRRGRHVLAACESYLRGSRGAVAGDGDAEATCSVGFRLALGRVVAGGGGGGGGGGGRGFSELGRSSTSRAVAAADDDGTASSHTAN
uniref:UBC core domain-containing protein n=1 Tax=Oryza brachyantha TaxID=4533 RepID=J3M424_ORYBR